MKFQFCLKIINNIADQSVKVMSLSCYSSVYATLLIIYAASAKSFKESAE